MSTLKTYHAPPERKAKNEISEEGKFVEEYGYLKDVFSAMPDVAVVLNDTRQIVYANEGLLSILPYKDHNEILGSRPGEAIDCINSRLTEGGCGTTEACRFCGAVNAVLQSNKQDEKVSMECRIVSFIEDEEVSFDYKVTASPIKIKGNTFTIMFMQDISAEKRKMALERIFFHDILNTAGGIMGFTGFLQQVEEPGTLKEYIKVVDQLSHDLIDEIKAQRALLLAESDDLKVNYEDTEAMKILEDVKDTVSYHVIAEGKDIVISSTRGVCNFSCDSTLIKRILINMVKNALEASEEKGQVLSGFYCEGSELTFYVHNDHYMTSEVQLQIFKRSFSTKGKDRGLGTYSIKLLTEKYLKGRVWFETDEIKGTTFFVQVPVKKA